MNNKTISDRKTKQLGNSSRCFYKKYWEKLKLSFEPYFFSLVEKLPLNKVTNLFIENITSVMTNLQKIATSDNSSSYKIKNILKSFAEFIMPYGFETRYYTQCIDKTLHYEEIAQPLFKEIETKYSLDNNLIHQYLLKNNIIIYDDKLAILSKKASESPLSQLVFKNIKLEQVKKQIISALEQSLPAFNIPVNTIGMYSLVDGETIFDPDFKSSFNQVNPKTGKRKHVFLTKTEAFGKLILEPSNVHNTIKGINNPLHKKTSIDLKSDFIAFAIKSKFHVFYITLTPTKTDIFSRYPFQYPSVVENMGSSLSFIMKNIGYQEHIEQNKIMLTNVNEQLQRQTYHDPLTNILNRRGMENNYFQAIGPELLRAAQKGIKKEVSVTMMDIDRFKRVNEVFDHIMGDVILKKLGAHMTVFFRITDIVARYGGEEFTALLPLHSDEVPDNKIDRIDTFRSDLAKQIFKQNLPLYEENPDILSVAKVLANLIHFEIEEEKISFKNIGLEHLLTKLKEYSIYFKGSDPKLNEHLLKTMRTVLDEAEKTLVDETIDIEDTIKAVAKKLKDLHIEKNTIELNLKNTISIGVSTLSGFDILKIMDSLKLDEQSEKNLKHNLLNLSDKKHLNSLTTEELCYFKALFDAISIADSNLNAAKKQGRNRVVR